jgi:putative DNA methylase
MLQPYEWKDNPALIEHLFPVQKLSVESFKEQEARQSKTLTPLGSVLWNVAFVNACY